MNVYKYMNEKKAKVQVYRSSGTNSRHDCGLVDIPGSKLKEGLALTSEGLVPSTYGKGLLWNFFCRVSVNKTASLALLMSWKLVDNFDGQAYRNSKVDSGSSRSVVGIVGIRCPGSRNVDDTRDLVVFQDYRRISLV